MTRFLRRLLYCSVNRHRDVLTFVPVYRPHSAVFTELAWRCVDCHCTEPIGDVAFLGSNHRTARRNS